MRKNLTTNQIASIEILREIYFPGMAQRRLARLIHTVAGEPLNPNASTFTVEGVEFGKSAIDYAKALVGVRPATLYNRIRMIDGSLDSTTMATTPGRAPARLPRKGTACRVTTA